MQRKPFQRLFLAFVCSLLLGLPRSALAAVPGWWATMSFSACGLFGGTAPCLALPAVQANLFTFAIAAAFVVCLAVFLVGCFLLVASGGKENLIEKGKGALKASLIGYAIIGMAYVIYNLVVWVLY